MYDKNPPENGGFVSNLKYPSTSDIFYFGAYALIYSGENNFCVRECKSLNTGEFFDD